MSIECDIPYSTKEGINYLIRFSQFDREYIPEYIHTSILDIVIETDANPNDIKNNASSLFQISKIIHNHANLHDAIYYCYCSNKFIPRSQNKLHLTHQEYRSLLFEKMFEKENNGSYINKKIIINDPDNGSHYIHLIAKIKHLKAVEQISEKLQENDK